MCLIKPTNKTTNFCLPCLIRSRNGYLRHIRYYDNEYMLISAYKQLKAIKFPIIPLTPLIYGESVAVI